jgi:hypothetical protein
LHLNYTDTIVLLKFDDGKVLQKVMDKRAIEFVVCSHSDLTIREEDKKAHTFIRSFQKKKKPFF